MSTLSITIKVSNLPTKSFISSKILSTVYPLSLMSAATVTKYPKPPDATSVSTTKIFSLPSSKCIFAILAELFVPDNLPEQVRQITLFPHSNSFLKNSWNS